MEFVCFVVPFLNIVVQDANTLKSSVFFVSMQTSGLVQEHINLIPRLLLERKFRRSDMILPPGLNLLLAGPIQQWSCHTDGN